MNTTEYIAQITHHASINEIADRAELVKSTLWRQVKNDAVSADNLIRIARAYDVNPVAALTSIGAITTAEAQQGKVVGDLSEASNDMLLKEVARRMIDDTMDADQPIILSGDDLKDLGLAANRDDMRDIEGTTPDE